MPTLYRSTHQQHQEEHKLITIMNDSPFVCGPQSDICSKAIELYEDIGMHHDLNVCSLYRKWLIGSIAVVLAEHERDG